LLTHTKIDENASRNGQTFDSVANKQSIDRLSDIVTADIAQPDSGTAYTPVSLPEQRSLGIIASAFGKSAVGYKLNSLLVEQNQYPE
jgi:hypothetical protein